MLNITGLRSCTVESKAHRFCGRPSIADGPFPICSRHAVVLFRFMADTLDSADDMTRLLVGFEDVDETRARTYRTERREKRESGVLYYLMIDGLVKIGYASDLDKRLTAYPPTAQLLATEPGDRSAEGARHREFAEYLSAGREWFTPGPRLRDYIESLRDYRAA